MSICECGHDRTHHEMPASTPCLSARGRGACLCEHFTPRIAPDLAVAGESESKQKRTKKVDDCDNCPFRHDTDFGSYCGVARTKRGYRDLPFGRPHEPPPDWCPLRRGPTLVVLDLPKT